MKLTDNSLNQETGPDADSPIFNREEESSQSELEKIKGMNRSDRLWYIAAYYKFHIIAAVVALVVIWQVGLTIYHGTFDTVLHCMYLNSYSSDGVNTAPTEQDFAQYLQLGKKEQITVESAFLSFGNDASEYSYASMAKITALTAAKDLDVLVGDQECIDHYASLNAFLNLEEALPADLLEQIRDRLYYGVTEDGSKIACAVDLSGTSFAADSNLTQTPPLFGIISNSQHIETAEAMLSWIFQKTPE